MSETGLLSGLYRQAHKYAELIDKVLMDLKSDPNSKGNPVRKELGTFLQQISEESITDVSTSLVVAALDSRKSLLKLDLGNIGKKLLSDGPVDPKIIEGLDLLAQVMEEKEVDAMTRMQRWTQ